MTSTDQPTVFVVDDDEGIRRSIEWMLKSVGLQVEVYESPRALLDRYDANRPGCMVLDLRLPGMNGLELHSLLAKRGCRHPFIMVTGHGEVPDAVDAMQQGAIDFIEKPYSRQQLLKRIHQALERDAVQRERESSREEFRSRMENLTDRERQVLSLVIAGNQTKEIATKLNLSHKTIEVHRSNIVKKTGIETMAELVVRLVKLGLAESIKK